MSDISVPLAYRTSAADASARSVTAPSAPLGLWATLAWGSAGILAILSVWLMLMAGIRLPWLLQFLPTSHIALAIVVLSAVLLSRRRLREYLALMPLSWRDVGRGIGYGVIGYVGFVLLLGLLAMLQAMFVQGEPTGATPIVGGPLTISTIVFLISYWMVMLVAAPITEELLFRGLLYRGLESRLGAAATIVLTSVVFGLLHAPGFGWIRVVATGSLGLLFGWLRWRTGSTSVSILAHATVNFIGAMIGTALILLTP